MVMNMVIEVIGIDMSSGIYHHRCWYTLKWCTIWEYITTNDFTHSDRSVVGNGIGVLRGSHVKDVRFNARSSRVCDKTKILTFPYRYGKIWGQHILTKDKDRTSTCWYEDKDSISGGWVMSWRINELRKGQKGPNPRTIHAYSSLQHAFCFNAQIQHPSWSNPWI
jgi:hypothetical protein